MIFLDSVSTLTETASVSYFDVIIEGGIPMVIIGLLSVWAVYVIAERFIAIQRANRNPDKLLRTVKNALYAGDRRTAVTNCEKDRTPFGRMLLKGLPLIGQPVSRIKSSVEATGELELHKLEKRLGHLALVASIAPMVGFLGTVLGMIDAFAAISMEEGSVSPKVLSEGIYKAMGTTAAGLVVGIVAYAGYNFLMSRIQKVIYRMKLTTFDFLDILQRPDSSRRGR